MTPVAAQRRARRTRFSPLAMLSHLYGVWRQRQALNRLDDAALRDIGLTRSEAEREARRVFWDAPGTWLR